MDVSLGKGIPSYEMSQIAFGGESSKWDQDIWLYYPSWGYVMILLGSLPGGTYAYVGSLGMSFLFGFPKGKFS